VVYLCQFLGADVSAHHAFLSCSVQCHLLSIFCTFVIEQINDDDDDVVDDTDGTDCWRRRTVSVVVAVRTRIWMWWAYRLSDSSRQCHSVANSTADRLNGLRQSYHPQHTLHVTPSSASVQDSQHCWFIIQQRLDLKSVEKSHPQFEHSGGHMTYRHTVANRWKPVYTAGKLGSRLGGGAAGHGNAAAARSLCVHS